MTPSRPWFQMPESMSPTQRREPHGTATKHCVTLTSTALSAFCATKRSRSGVGSLHIRCVSSPSARSPCSRRRIRMLSKRSSTESSQTLTGREIPRLAEPFCGPIFYAGIFQYCVCVCSHFGCVTESLSASQVQKCSKSGF